MAVNGSPGPRRLMPVRSPEQESPMTTRRASRQPAMGFDMVMEGRRCAAVPLSRSKSSSLVVEVLVEVTGSAAAAIPAAIWAWGQRAWARPRPNTWCSLVRPGRPCSSTRPCWNTGHPGRPLGEPGQGRARSPGPRGDCRPGRGDTLREACAGRGSGRELLEVSPVPRGKPAGSSSPRPAAAAASASSRYSSPVLVTSAGFTRSSRRRGRRRVRRLDPVEDGVVARGSIAAQRLGQAVRVGGGSAKDACRPRSADHVMTSAGRSVQADDEAPGPPGSEVEGPRRPEDHQHVDSACRRGSAPIAATIFVGEGHGRRGSAL